MKPLTIEQLKALKVGDWVWIEDTSCDQKYYAEVIDFTYPWIELIVYGHKEAVRWEDVGSRYLIYKNKEQAEAKGGLYQTAFELILQDVYENRLQTDTLSCSSCPFMFELFDGCENQGLYEDCKKRWQDYYLSEAERRLAELTKE